MNDNGLVTSLLCLLQAVYVPMPSHIPYRQMIVLHSWICISFINSSIASLMQYIINALLDNTPETNDLVTESY